MKTCPKCGYTTENVQAKFCKNCGAKFSDVTIQDVEFQESQDVPETQSVDVSIDASLENSYLPYDEEVDNSVEREFEQLIGQQEEPAITSEFLKENSKIGGWLAFFLFSTCLGGALSAIMAFVGINSPGYPNSTLLALADVSFGVMLCGLAIYTSYSFTERKPNSVYLGKLYVTTIFLSNLLSLFGGDYESTGLGSLTQITRGLVWSVIWFVFLCVSYSVKKVIPKEYRKISTSDYIITAALYLIPIILLVVGVATL